MASRVGASTPPVTVGMPVYNGERYLEQAVKSLLVQTEGDFSLIISDNGSTDQTPAICRAFAASDSRVSYVRHEENRGAVWNFNWVFHAGRSPLFMWAAADDLWEPRFLQRCRAAIHERPDAVGAFSAQRQIDPDGRQIGPTIIPPQTISDANVSVRAQTVFQLKSYSVVYGVMKRPFVARTGLMGPGWGPDMFVLLGLALQGPILIVPEVLYAQRIYEGRDWSRVIRDGRFEASDRERAQPWTSLFSRLLLHLLRAKCIPISKRVESVPRIVRTLYEPTSIWRGAILAELANVIRASIESREVGPMLVASLARTILDPMTPARMVSRWRSEHSRIR